MNRSRVDAGGITRKVSGKSVSHATPALQPGEGGGEVACHLYGEPLRLA